MIENGVYGGFLNWTERERYVAWLASKLALAMIQPNNASLSGEDTKDDEHYMK